MKLLIASNNKAKREELVYIKKLIPTIEIVFPEDIGINDEPEETGKTFRENAELKAKWYGEKSGLLSLADDGGTEIDYLNGEPGVHSKRWMGRDATDEELIAFTLKNLENIPDEKRSAKMTTCLCLYDPQTKGMNCVQESVAGHMAHVASGRKTKGFPYRALFIVSRFNKYYDELSEEEHTQINHRRIALGKIAPIIASYVEHWFYCKK